MRAAFVILAVILSFEEANGQFTTTHATNIHTAIFGTSYNKYVRPSATTYVDIELNLLSLNDLDMKNQVMSTSGWLTITWNDPRLTWTAASYGNIEYIYTKQDKIWRPELIIDNSVEDMAPIGDTEIFFKIKNTGAVRWDPPGQYVTHCDIDVSYYPFDYQKCSIEITTFAFTTDVVILNKTKDSVNVDDFKENGEWVLDSSSVVEQVLTENGEMFSQLEFKLIFKRRPGYYLTNVVYPVILVSLLTNLVFLLPVDSGEKISYILTVLLAQAVLLTLVGDSMPTTSKHTPVIGIYISFVLVMAALAIVITIVNLRLHLRADQTEVPRWLKSFTFIVLLKVNCLSAKVKDQNKNHVVSQNDTLELQDDNGRSKSLECVKTNAWKNQDEEFPFECKEVSYLLDIFFFYLFNIITFVVTVVLLVVLAVCDRPI